MQRREFLKATGSAMIMAATPWGRVFADQPRSSNPGGRLNLVLITADDMNATMPGWMGNPLPLTPRMDAFAATCHRMVHNRGAAPICQPSRQAMMTGLVPHRSGGYGFNPVRPGTPSLATICKTSGHFIAAMNKITHMAPESVFPWDLKFDNGGKNPEAVGRNFAECLKAAKDAGKPFFINCNITDPHRPFYGAGPNGKSPEGGAPVGILAHDLTPREVSVPSFLEDIPDVRQEISQYYNSVQRLDMSLGKILDTLHASGEYDRTVILFVSDHGMPFPFAKATLYSNGSWVPAILHYPGMGPPKTFDEYTGNVDIMPTLLDLLGLPKPQGIDGRSWVPLFQGEKQTERDYGISHVNTVSSGKYFPQRVVQTRQGALCFAPWSDGETQFHCESMQGLTYNALVEAGKTNPRIQQRLNQYLVGIPLAFYDLEKDPDQRNNVLADPQYRAQIEQLKQILYAHMERTQDPEFGNFKLVLAGQRADIKATTNRIKQEEKELMKYRITRGENAG